MAGLIIDRVRHPQSRFGEAVHESVQTENAEQPPLAQEDSPSLLDEVMIESWAIIPDPPGAILVVAHPRPADLPPPFEITDTDWAPE